MKEGDERRKIFRWMLFADPSLRGLFPRTSPARLSDGTLLREVAVARAAALLRESRAEATAQEAERRAHSHPRRPAGPGQDPAWAQPRRGFRDVRRLGTGMDEATDPCWV